MSPTPGNCVSICSKVKSPMRATVAASRFWRRGPALRSPRCRRLPRLSTTSTSKDGKFGREETTGIASLVAGICAANPQDEQRVAQGAAVFDNLYQYFAKRG